MAGLQQQLGAQLVQAAKIMEEQLDQEMNRYYLQQILRKKCGKRRN